MPLLSCISEVGLTYRYYRKRSIGEISAKVNAMNDYLLITVIAYCMLRLGQVIFTNFELQEVEKK